MLDLSDLRAFARVADLGSVSGAARALGSPKSTVSRSLGRLETQLGTVLLERSSRGLRLSDAGVLFRPYALRILDDVEEAETALDGLTGSPRGTLRVNAAVTFAIGLVAPMLPGFCRRYPDVRVVLETENRVIDLQAEEADVAIRIGKLADSSLMARRLADIELWACASRVYLDEHGTPTTVDALCDHTLIGWSDRQTDWGFTTPDGITVRMPLPPGTIIPEPSVLQVVLCGGGGIGRLPDFLARPLVQSGELIRVLPDHRPDSVEAHALYPSHRSLSSKVRVFIDALVAHMRHPVSNA
jgi:DNA-binding transcriptional LysR family regulator